MQPQKKLRSAQDELRRTQGRIVWAGVFVAVILQALGAELARSSESVQQFAAGNPFLIPVSVAGIAGLLGIVTTCALRAGATDLVFASVRSFTDLLHNAVNTRDYNFRFGETECEEFNRLASVCDALFADIQRKESALNLARAELQSQVKALQHQVSERKRAQAASARLTAILEATPDLVATVDPLGAVLYLNRSARRMLRVEDGASLAPYKFSDFHPGWAAKIISTEGIPGALHAGSWEGETAIRSGGSEIHVSHVIIAHRNATGGLEYFSTIMRDITERRAAQEAIRISQEKLLETTRLAGRAEVATGVLHNVGNVLNSVNVSAGLLLDRLRRTKAPKLAQAAALLNSQNGNLGNWITQDPSGSKLPAYFAKLGEFFTAENAFLLNEVQQLAKNVEHVKEVIAMQQSYAKVSGAFEDLAIRPIVEDAVSMNSAVLDSSKITVNFTCDDVPQVRADRHKVLQILVNLIRNARHALHDSGADSREIDVRITAGNPNMVDITVKDNGIGISPENLTKIFAHGFTTRKNGHGFGLHSGALAAREMGGSLNVQSAGLGTGAAFTLSLPVADK